MNERGDVPAPTPGRLTIYVGAKNDVGFSHLHGQPHPGRDGIGDEIDELALCDDTRFQISEGAGEPAPERDRQPELAGPRLPG